MKASEPPETKAFVGLIRKADRSCFVRFQVSVSTSGELHLSFEDVPLNDDNFFLLDEWYERDSFVRFTILGRSQDNWNFESESLIFTSVGDRSDSTGSYITLRGKCVRARMIGALDRSVERPLLVYLIRGFRCFRAITADSTLGRVSMIGRTDISNFNEITGQLALEKDISRSYKQWRKDAQNMLDHVLLVMSFASGTYLRVPIHRLYERRKVTIDFYDVSVVVKPTWPAIHYLDLSGILQTAADNFGGLPVRVAKFPYAVEWILLPTTYNEIRLISRMTALENLAHHNLNARESRYMGRSSFDRLAAQIRGVIRAANLPPDAGDSMAASVGELNRKSLEAKILELMERWEVPMGDLPKNTVADIIKARNHVVHRGVYSHESSDQDLWHHVVLLNEIVTRLVLALLRFRGMYECYVGGHHRRRFPECERV